MQKVWAQLREDGDGNDDDENGEGGQRPAEYFRKKNSSKPERDQEGRLVAEMMLPNVENLQFCKVYCRIIRYQKLARAQLRG